MKILGLTLVALTSVFLTSCATVEKKEIHSTPQATPTHSKTLKAEVKNTKSLKRKVAISRFTNETSYGQSYFIDSDQNRIGKQAMDILSAKLFETGRFIMLESADLNKVEQELNIEGIAESNNSADFIIVGSITQFGRKDVSDVGVFSRVKKQEANATVHIRIIDVATRQIIYSEQGSGTAFSEAGTVFGVGDKAGYDSSLNDQVLNVAITDLASNIVENMLDKPWRSYILAFEDDNLIISGGESQNISTGAIFNVLKAGKKVKNPQTGMFMQLPGKVIAEIEVSGSFGETPITEVSFSTIIKGDLSKYIKANDFSELYIQEKIKDKS